jgi:hypothetical protein
MKCVAIMAFYAPSVKQYSLSSAEWVYAAQIIL